MKHQTNFLELIDPGLVQADCGGSILMVNLEQILLRQPGLGLG